MTTRHAWGYGLATMAENNDTLDVWYPAPELGSAPEQSSPYEVPADLGALERIDPDRGVRQTVVRVQSDLDTPPTDAADAYLRLHLLSHRLVHPNEINLTGIFGVLHTVVWTDHGPCPVDDFESTRLRLRAATGRRVAVLAVDKLPRMVDYVVPSGVRIADADRVRLGAHLASGTTVMHEGFVNYNAGTLGTAMIEGRISQGVVVGDGSDVGGGASIMGTLSGGGKVVVTIGKHSLLGANAGIGIALGDHCIVEAGLYVTAGTKILLSDADGTQSTVKGSDLSGVDHLLFRRNSQTGAVEAHVRNDQDVQLNTALHQN